LLLAVRPARPRRLQTAIPLLRNGGGFFALRSGHFRSIWDQLGYHGKIWVNGSAPAVAPLRSEVD